MNEEQITFELARMGYADAYAVDGVSNTFKLPNGRSEQFFAFAQAEGYIESVHEVSYEEYCDLNGFEPDYGNGYHEYENWD